VNFILALARLVLIALGLAIVIGWLKNEDADLALTLPWTLYPVSGGLVAARAIFDWEASHAPRDLVFGAARIAGFFTIVCIARYGFPHSITAVAAAFVTTAMLAVYRTEA
jgi:hypothetical protein